MFIRLMIVISLHFSVLQGLVLLSLTSESRLPWSGTRSEEECRRTKQACDIKKLCTEQGLPELSEIILACRTAVRTVRPDYEAFHKVLVKMRDRKVFLQLIILYLFMFKLAVFLI